jgi:hypothetical protein
MSTDYSFVGAVNRDNAMSAVADTMNSLTLDILKATMEMGGKQVVEKDGNAYALERLDSSEIKKFKENVSVTAEFTIGTATCILTKGETDAAGVTAYYGKAGSVNVRVTVNGATKTVFEGNSATPVVYASSASTSLTATAKLPDTQTVFCAIDDEEIAGSIFDVLGINPETDIDGKIDGNNWKIQMSSDGDSVTMKVAYIDASTGDTMIMGVKLGDDGSCKGLSAIDNKSGMKLETAIESSDLVISDVDGGGLLKSWGINNPEELQPGDLFLVQQKLQIIKDTVSAVHTTGKTQGDIMREATQKFAQG